MAVPIIVLDTNVVVSALRSELGASNKLLQLVGTGGFEYCLSDALALEYEEVAKRHVQDSIFTAHDIELYLAYIFQNARFKRIYYLWRPVLRDANDDMILELAVASGCNYIVTFNTKDFSECKRFGLAAITPGEFLKILEAT